MGCTGCVSKFLEKKVVQLLEGGRIGHEGTPPSQSIFVKV